MPSATLLIAAQADQVILPAVYEFLNRNDVCPNNTQEYSVAAGRFTRIEWQFANQQHSWLETDQFDADFSELARSLNLIYTISFSHQAFQLGLFCPGQNVSLEKILHKYSPLNGDDMQVSFVIGDCHSLQTSANRYGVPYFNIETGDDVAREAQFLQLISRYKPDLFAMLPPNENLSAALLEKLPCSVLAVSAAQVPSNTPGLVLDVSSAGAGVLLASAFLLQADVNKPQLVVQHAKPLLQRQVREGDLLRSGSEQQELEMEVLVRALAKFTYNKVISYKQYLYAFE